MHDERYNVTEEQMLNALRRAIEETFKIQKGQEDEANHIVSSIRDYISLNPDAEIYLQTKYGTISQKLSKCEVYSPNGQNIMFIWK